MTEVPASKSSPERNSDQSDGTENVTANQEGTSEEFIDVVATTSSDETRPDCSRDINGDPQTSAGGDSLSHQLFSDSDEENSNYTSDLYKFSDNDFGVNFGSLSSGNSESSFEEVCHTTDDRNKINRDIENMKKKMKEIKNKSEDTMDSSSDEEDCVQSRRTSIDGARTRYMEAFAGIWNQFTSSDDGGECSKKKFVSNKGTDPLKDSSSSDDDIKYTPSYEHAYSADGGECSKQNKLSGPSKETKTSDDEEANTNDTSINTEVVVAGPSNAGQDQVKSPPKNKAERKMNYTLPFKKSKKF